MGDETNAAMKERRKRGVDRGVHVTSHSKTCIDLTCLCMGRVMEFVFSQ